MQLLALCLLKQIIKQPWEHSHGKLGRANLSHPLQQEPKNPIALYTRSLELELDIIKSN